MKKNLLSSLLGIFLFFASSTDATMYLDFNSHTLLKCVLSSTHHNRIALSEGRIKKAIFPEANVSIRLEDESGQVFVQVLSDEINPITLSILTEEGAVQDLELDFTPKSSEIVILNRKSNTNDSDCENECSNGEIVSIDSMVGNLQEILKGQTPYGYVSQEGNGNEYLLKKHFLLTEKVRYVSQMHTITVWEIKNLSRCCKNISERDLNFEGISWVYLDKNQLKKLEKTLAVTSVKNYE